MGWLNWDEGVYTFMAKLKMGFIGVGSIAQKRHIPSFKQLAG